MCTYSQQCGVVSTFSCSKIIIGKRQGRLGRKLNKQYILAEHASLLKLFMGQCGQHEHGQQEIETGKYMYIIYIHNDYGVVSSFKIV